MYVIFPADEVVYLSYGRLIVVPANTNPGSSSCPIRRNSPPLEFNSRITPTNANASNSNPYTESVPGSSKIECNLTEGQPSLSRGCSLNSQSLAIQDLETPPEIKSKKKSLRLNFSLLKRNNSKNNSSEPQSSRVRYSVGHRDQSGLATPPTEAFKRFCNISSSTPANSGESSTNTNQKRSSKEKEKSPSVLGFKLLSKRSSSSSKNSKPSSVIQDDQASKRSSKHSSSSSRSNKDKNSPVSLADNDKISKRFPNQNQKYTQRGANRNISASTSLSADVFYPLSTSREKNLVEPSPEPQLKHRSSSFRLSFRRSKTPDVLSTASQPYRPERKKDKKPPAPIKSKNIPDRKLSFSDFVSASREKPLDDRREVLVSSEKLKVATPVLGFLRKTPSPKNLGRDRTPYLSRESSLYANQDSLRASTFEEDSRPTNSGHKPTSGEGFVPSV